MGITISFSMRPRKNWIAGQGWSAEKLQKFAAQLAGELGYQYEAAGESVSYTHLDVYKRQPHTPSHKSPPPARPHMPGR